MKHFDEDVGPTHSALQLLRIAAAQVRLHLGLLLRKKLIESLDPSMAFSHYLGYITAACSPTHVCRFYLILVTLTLHQVRSTTVKELHQRY